jgi:hypothetical protein
MSRSMVGVPPVAGQNLTLGGVMVQWLPPPYTANASLPVVRFLLRHASSSPVPALHISCMLRLRWLLCEHPAAGCP